MAGDLVYWFVQVHQHSKYHLHAVNGASSFNVRAKEEGVVKGPANSEPEVTVFTGRSQALLRAAEPISTLPRFFLDFISIKNKIKKVLLSMSPKIAIFSI